MIDIHTHIGRVRRQDTWMTDAMLVRQMDGYGIEKAVVLPLCGAPEAIFFSYTNEQVLESYRKFPDRFIPFRNLDPRQAGNSPKTDFSPVLKEYRDKGCRGVGEVVSGLYFDDPRAMNFFRHCGQAGMPIVFHLASTFEGQYGLVDDIHLPRMEKALRALPETVFFGHGHTFWAEISCNSCVSW